MRKHSITFFIINTLLVLSMVMNSPLKQSESAFTSPITHVKTNVPSDFSNVKLNADTVNLTILYINDWHGWLEPHDGRGGAATYMSYFKQEGFNASDDSFLLLNGGDENTGPAVATLTKGESMMDVMNAMNFTASAIGNHEFDYGIDWLNYRQNIANFPLLSCNIYDVGTTDLANFTIPWVVQEHAGIQVGIVGLTTTSTYTSAHPKYTQYYDFGNYETALRNNVPAMRAAGADVIIALTHVVPNELISLAADVADLNISVFLGGHGGTPQVTEVSGSIVAMAGHYAQQYVRIVLEVDTTLDPKLVVSQSGHLVANTEGGVTPDAEIQQVVDYWVDLVGADEVISYASTAIYDPSPESGIGNRVADGMIDYFNWTHDFSITNRGGGIRDYFRAGDVTMGDVVSVIPFENNMLELSITGQELLDILTSGHGYYAIGNIRYSYSYDGGFHITSAYINSTGTFEEIIPTNIYTGLMIDYVWWVSFKDVYPATDTGFMYRDAAINYIRKIPDISLVAYDGRIQEGDVVVPELSRNHLIFLILSSSFVVIIFLKRKTLKKRLNKTK